MHKILLPVIAQDVLRKILALCVVVLIASFLGFIVENIWISLRHGYLDNRGMHLPILLGYGLANLVIYGLFGTPDHPKLYFLQEYAASDDMKHLLYALVVFVFITVCESLFGNLIYRVCHIEWWNYNSIPLHIGQYTSIPTSIGFTACIYIYIDKIFAPLYSQLTLRNIECHSLPILALSVLAIVDCAYALYYMYQHKAVKVIFHIEMRLHKRLKLSTR